MLNYHGNLKTDSPHPYQSSCYTWPFDLRPVFFFRGYYLPENMVSVIWCMASPLLAWGGLAAVLYLLGLRGKGKKFDAQGIPFIVVGALAQYLPWMIISREVFIYHYFATLPFVVFAIIYVLRYWEENYKWGKKATWIVVGVAILLFLAFYPALTGVPMSREWASVIRWPVSYTHLDVYKRQRQRRAGDDHRPQSVLRHRRRENVAPAFAQD